MFIWDVCIVFEGYSKNHSGHWNRPQSLKRRSFLFPVIRPNSIFKQAKDGFPVNLRMKAFFLTRKYKQKMPDLGKSFANIQIYIYMKNENLKKNKQFRQKDKKKNIRKGSIHLQQWMWTGLRLQQPTSDLLTDNVMCTAYCRRVRAIAWLAFFMHHGWTDIPGCKPWLFEQQPPHPLH